MLFVIALVWLAGIIVAGLGSIAGGLFYARRLSHRPLVAVPSGVALGAAAAPTFLFGAYLFFIGWPVALLLWLLAGLYGRFVGSIRKLQIGFSIIFLISWLAVTTADQAAQRYSDPVAFALDGLILLSPLAALLILSEFGAFALADKRRSETVTEA
jgi:hypothetical protein